MTKSEQKKVLQAVIGVLHDARANGVFIFRYIETDIRMMLKDAIEEVSHDKPK